jgi:hypothetical protein
MVSHITHHIFVIYRRRSFLFNIFHFQKKCTNIHDAGERDVNERETTQEEAEKMEILIR